MNFIKELVLLPSKSINAFYGLFTGGKKRPIYFDSKTTRPELRVFNDNFDEIINELKKVQELQSIPAYEEIDKYQVDKERPKTQWKVFVLNLMGDFTEIALDVCPKTCDMIDAIPNVFQAFFSVLEPGRSIPAHKGPYMGYLRYHLGLIVPKNNPPYIRIEDTRYTWKEGESVLFDDSWEHEVINNSTEERIVLIVDILRPMPLLPHTINKLMTKYVIRHSYAKDLMKKNNLFFEKK